MLLVVANFDRDRTRAGPVRIPRELAELVGLTGTLRLRQLLDRIAIKPDNGEAIATDQFIHNGHWVTLTPQSTAVFEISV
ncbi:MAG: hypothetical protein QM754_01375 [Tepidisphaeraceae bacterium]